MSKTTEMLHSIDKTVGITAEKVASLTDSFRDHKDSDNKRREKQAEWELRLEKAVKECPEAGHIKEQNGKLDRMAATVQAVKIFMKWILIITAITSTFLMYMKYVNGAGELIEYKMVDSREVF
jgi:hypothetical protein